MKKSIIVFSLMFIVFSVNKAFCQNYNDKQNIQVSTNQEPVYPQGEKAFYEYVNSNIRFSDEAKKNYIKGDVTMSFDVKADSTISNVMVISGIGYGIDEEITRIIEKTKFAPAVQNGFKVRMNVMITIPVVARENK